MYLIYTIENKLYQEKLLVVPKGESHSYIAAATAVNQSDAKIATHSCALNGIRKADKGTGENREKERQETPE